MNFATKLLSRAKSVAAKAKVPWMAYRGFSTAARWMPSTMAGSEIRARNALRKYFEAHHEGPGIWKWNHYFDVYEQHFSRFVGQEVHVVEVGVFSGGSLAMWREYFGSKCRVYGIDIEPACKVYENEYTKIFIGDQADRSFWRRVRSELPAMDILIDDGGHMPEQQIVTLEETLPFLRPGGVYLCEDIHGALNSFAAYVHGLSHRLNTLTPDESDASPWVFKRNMFQNTIHSIHLYPLLAVIERHAGTPEPLSAPRRGTDWQPYL